MPGHFSVQINVLLPVLVESMERHGHFELAPESLTEKELSEISQL